MPENEEPELIVTEPPNFVLTIALNPQNDRSRLRGRFESGAAATATRSDLIFY